VGNAACTLLFGPWLKEGLDRVSMPLDEGQRFIAQKSDRTQPQSVAAVDPNNLKLYTQAAQIPTDQVRLQGTVVALGLDKISQCVRVSVTVGHIVFHSFFQQNQSAAENVMPGQKVWIAYRPNEVQWFDQHTD